MNDIQKHIRQDPGTQIRLVPGDIVYEKLIRTNPKKLKRMVEDEKKLYLKTHALGWNEARHASAERGQALIDRLSKKGNDGKLLGLDTITETLTKRLVKNAYRRAARKMHPDVGGSEEAFKQLHEAYRRVLAVAKA